MDRSVSQAVEVQRVPWSAEALAHLRAAESYDTTGGLECLDRYAAMGLPLFTCEDEVGQVVGRYVLDLYRGGGVSALHVMAAAGGSPGLDMTRVMLTAIEQQARALGVSWVSMQTIRAGLVRKLMGAGYAVHGHILRKRMSASQ